MVTDVGNTAFAARMEAVVQTLKPCPFCASRALKPSNIIVDDSSVNDFSVVFCADCGTRGPKSECWESAAEAWNRRSCNGCDGRGCPKCNPRIREIAWLIELPGTQGMPVWWTAAGWTKDSLQAVRFSRREDAERTARGLSHPGMTITEHEWE